MAAAISARRALRSAAASIMVDGPVISFSRAHPGACLAGDQGSGTRHHERGRLPRTGPAVRLGRGEALLEAPPRRGAQTRHQAATMHLRTKDCHEAVHPQVHSAFGAKGHAFDLNCAYRAMAAVSLRI